MIYTTYVQEEETEKFIGTSCKDLSTQGNSVKLKTIANVVSAERSKYNNKVQQYFLYFGLHLSDLSCIQIV